MLFPYRFWSCRTKTKSSACSSFCPWISKTIQLVWKRLSTHTIVVLSNIHICSSYSKGSNNTSISTRPQLEKELTYDKFMKWTDPVSMSESEVRVALPRFKMTEKYDMKRFLTNMGMVDVFDVALSDLSGETRTAKPFLRE